jgi:hypothetical protein
MPQLRGNEPILGLNIFSTWHLDVGNEKGMGV